MSRKDRLKELYIKKHNLINSLTSAIRYDDVLFANALEIEFKATLKEISRLEKELNVKDK